MGQAASQTAALHISAVTAELVARILAEYHQAQMIPRREPYADGDISLVVISMKS